MFTSMTLLVATKTRLSRNDPRPQMRDYGMVNGYSPDGKFQYRVAIPEMGSEIRQADGELVKGCLSGLRHAWTEFYRRYHSLIEAVVRRQAQYSTKEEREDLVQEVYESLVGALEGYDERSSSLGTFVSIVAKRTCIDCWRSRSSMSRTGMTVPVEHHDNSDGEHVPLKSNCEPPDEQVAKYEVGAMMKTALSRLSETCQKLLKLRFFNEFTYEEIGEKVGKKANTMNVRVLRCIARLRAAYEELEKGTQRA